MTIKEVVGILKEAKTITLGWDGCAIQFDKDNPLMLEAYGNFVVNTIRAVGDADEGYFEVDIAMLPVKVGV